MGVYYTCSTCQKTEKGFWPCDCPEKEAKKNMERKIGSKLVKYVLDNNGINEYLYEMLIDKDGEVFYLSTCLGGAGGQYDDPWKIVEVDETSFTELTEEPEKKEENVKDNEYAGEK